jgi:prepilin-type processing-associated H-X9-DG protein
MIGQSMIKEMLHDLTPNVMWLDGSVYPKKIKGTNM